jgi:hypothetical protein
MKHDYRFFVLLLLPIVAFWACGEDQPPIRVGHVYPNLTVMAPGVGSTSETGIGALIPWADRLWAVGYVAHIAGEG